MGCTGQMQYCSWPLREVPPCARHISTFFQQVCSRFGNWPQHVCACVFHFNTLVCKLHQSRVSVWVISSGGAGCEGLAEGTFHSDSATMAWKQLQNMQPHSFHPGMQSTSMLHLNSWHFSLSVLVCCWYWSAASPRPLRLHFIPG